MNAEQAGASSVLYRLSPPIENAALNDLFGAAWAAHTVRDFAPILQRSLAYVCAYTARQPGETLIGFVNLAWDGGIHAFLLDTTVHPRWQQRGIGSALVQRAIAAAKERGIQWIHVDYEVHLALFYESCGFRPTLAGLLWLDP